MSSLVETVRVALVETARASVGGRRALPARSSGYAAMEV
jgi:hypothetical protein